MNDKFGDIGTGGHVGPYETALNRPCDACEFRKGIKTVVAIT
ncbi:hypothetical protein [Acetobacterium tundrae]|nr:hypothetical protein [Acetobacterium tundrae]